MRIWLDCSSLMDWKYSHLTGIQRTVLGIHKGWKACGIEPMLFRYHSGLDGFVKVALKELPELIRMNLENQGWISITTVEGAAREALPEGRIVLEAPNGAGPQRLKKRVVRRMLGEGPSADDLRQAMAEMNLSIWRLRKATVAWLPKRLGLKKEQPAVDNPRGRESLDPDVESRRIRVGEGDYLFSIGSECYQMPENARAARAVKQQGAKLVRMIYDMIPALQPQWVSDRDSTVFSCAVSEVLLSSDHILTISEWSHKDILKFAKEQGINAPPIHTIRLGDELPSGYETRAIEPIASQRPSRAFFLCLGTIEPRKNHRLLYEVWRSLAAENPKKCPDLVCIGARSWLCNPLIHEMTNDPLVKDRVLVLEGVSDNHLEWYYQHCLATVFPSLYEGWGLPVAESLARGRLCLASNATSIIEIGHDACTFFDPGDAKALKELIKHTMADPNWRANAEMQIRGIYKQTTWKTTAQHTLRAIEVSQLQEDEMDMLEA